MVDMKIKGLKDELSLYVGQDLALRREAGAVFLQDHSVIPAHPLSPSPYGERQVTWCSGSASDTSCVILKQAI